MSSNLTKFTENIVYRSNIFNYDTKFFEDFSKGPQSLNIDAFKDSSFKFALDNISKFNNFINTPLKDQLQHYNSLIDLLFETDETKKPTNKEAKISIQIILDILKNSFNFYKRNEDQRLQDQQKWDVAKINVSKQQSESAEFNLMYCLLYLDGLIMNNIELASVFDLLSSDVGVKLQDLIFDILNYSLISNIAKEVASHILSAIALFMSNHDEIARKLINWTISYNETSERKRDNCFTSNFSLILANDLALDLFINEFKSKRSLQELLTILTKDYSINTVYEAFLCIWNISNNENFIYLFENRDEALLEKIIQVIKTNKVEKIIRIGTLLIKNLLKSERCSEILIDFQFVKTIKNLLSNKWSDEVIKEELNFISDYLEKNNKFVK